MQQWMSVTVCTICVFGCAANEPQPASGPESADQAYKRSAAAHLASALADPSARTQLIASLHQRSPIALSELAALTGDLGPAPAGSVPEVTLREPAAASDSSGMLVAWAPGGNEHAWTDVPAYALGGAQLALDPQRAPDAPVLVVETHGRLAMQADIAAGNQLLQSAGLQRSVKDAPLSATSFQTSLLTSIRLVNDEEPWISGAAEIYAIVSGVVGTNDPQMVIVDMPYLDNDGTTYSPNQILINWSGFQYQVANIQLFEHDSNTNYQDLITAIITAVGAVGSLAGEPVIQAVTDIANRIVAAIPASVFTNDDDYVDSFYTLEETATYTNRVGAANNATISLRPFTVVSN